MNAIHHECELERHIVERLQAAGWLVGRSPGYDAARALYPEDVLHWLQESQPEAWAKLEKLHGAGAGKAVLDRLVKALEHRDGGTLEVLRRGFGIAGGGQLAMGQALPEDGRNDIVARRYAANRLRVVPQLRYSLHKGDELDLALFVNGLPVATVELKTDFTQSVQAAMAQYRDDRPPLDPASGQAEPLLGFRRGAVVHFALSDSECWMTTRLAGAGTVFLPFNRGCDGAAGNPPGEGGDYPTAYLWQRVLRKDAWLRILHRFVLMQRREVQDAAGRSSWRESMVFPRFHQWEGVTALVEAVRAEGPGQPYLIQHSAGSGKTNTIAWTAHELIRLRRADGEPFFHSVIVVTDRTVLDSQLQEAIAQIDHQHGVVKAVEAGSGGAKSEKLARAMLEGVPIIVCTLQTFPYAQKAVLAEQSLRERRFAVVIDEAHSSTSGHTADDLRWVLTGQSEAEWERLGTDERLSVWQSSRQRPGNASYFAFTATPKHSTLSLFGRPRDPARAPSADNPPVPFHSYTMQQAIEEGFILDVLKGYTSYGVALRIGTLAAKDRRVDEKGARRALARWLSLHPTNVAQKVELIAEHFRRHVAPLLSGQAKAMVVTSSRAAAVKYQLALERYCAQQGYADMRSMVAFSGEVPNQDVADEAYPSTHAFNESNMNPSLAGRDMRKVFDAAEWRVMIVANKYQTGFDQPKLAAMYLDKKVSGVEAVQTLSRLNRTFPGKERTFVIDFANEPQEIEAAFRTFYRDAQVSDVQDPNIVYDLKLRLDAMGLYEEGEVRAFAAAAVDRGVTHQKLYSLTQPPTDRYNGKLKVFNQGIAQWDEAWRQAEEAGDEAAMKHADTQRSELVRGRDELLVFAQGLATFVRHYDYVAQLVDLGDPALEGFAAFARLLRKRLQGVAAEQVDLGALQLTHYRINPGDSLAGLSSHEPEPEPLHPITDSGLREAKDRERKYLSELIERLNQALGKDVSPADQVAFAVHVSEKLRGNAQVVAQVANNSKAEAMKADLPGATVQAIVGAMGAHEKVATRLLSDAASREKFLGVIYEMLASDRTAEIVQAVRSIK